MNKPMSKEDIEFLEVVNYAKQHDKTAYNCLLCYLIVVEHKKKGQAVFDGAIWKFLTSLSRGEYKRMIKLNRERQREEPAFSADIESTIHFIRSHLMTRTA